MKQIVLKLADAGHCKIIQDPSNPDIHHIEALVSFEEAAKLSRGNANVRPPSEKKPFKAMMNTIELAPRIFHLRNRGITYITTQASYDPSALTITIPAETKLERWGIADGGHTFEAIKQTVESLEDYKDVTNWTMPYVQIKFVITEKAEHVASIVEGRNTSLQVQQYTLDEYNDRFDDLKKALDLSGLSRDLVAYRENEDKEWHIVEIVQRLACFLRERWIRTQPTAMYKSKSKALRLFTNPTTSTEFNPLLSPVLKDIVTLPEFIQAEFSRGHIINGRKFGRLKSVKPLNKPWTRPGTNYITNHKMDAAVLLPMAAAFRELLEINKRGQYQWKLPYQQVFRQCAAELYEVLVEHTSRARLGGHVASDMDYWGACLYTVMRTKERMMGGKLPKQEAQAAALDDGPETQST